MSSWTIDRLLLEPKEALRQLQEQARLTRDANKRINDLLAANDRYLTRARAAEAELAGRRPTAPLTAAVLADALGCFWNAAIGEAHARQGGMDVASVMAVGIAAIATRLAEGDHGHA